LTKSDYTVFQLTTIFSPADSPVDPLDANEPPSPPISVTVERRYSDFVLLHSLLVQRFPIVVVPNLPSKTYAGRFQEGFVETRRRDLERWCSRVGRHAVLRSTEEVRGFLALESDTVRPTGLSSFCFDH
jgi:sorting nexin-9/18/33